jgi:hypothetical protein
MCPNRRKLRFDGSCAKVAAGLSCTAKKRTHFLGDAASGALESRLMCPPNTSAQFDYYSVPISTQEAAILYLPLINHEQDDVMLVANLSRALLPAFEHNHKSSSTVRFQRFIAVDGIALIYPAVSARHVLPAYPGFSALNDLRESASFTHSSCPRQVVFVLDVSSKSMHFDPHHRSEALILRVFRLLNPHDHVQLILTSSASQKVALGGGSAFVAADARAYAALQNELGHLLRSGFLFLDSGISLAQDLLLSPPALPATCVKKMLIVLSSDGATLLPATINRHVSMKDSRDSAGNPLQPYFVFISMDSDGRGPLAASFCSDNMIYRSIPPMQMSIYRGLDVLHGVPSSTGFYSDVSFSVMRYCTFLFELLVDDGAAPPSSDGMHNVIWSPPHYDPASAPGSLIITSSMPVYTNNSGTVRFRGTVEVDHVFFTFPSVTNLRISRSDSSVASLLNSIPLFLGSKVGISLTALGVGMSLVDASFLFKLNALVLPMQAQFSGIKCGTSNAASEIFPDFMSTRRSMDFAALLQWNDIDVMGSQTFFEVVMNSPAISGHATVSRDGQSLFFRHAESASLVFLLKFPHFIDEVAVPSANSVATQCSANSAACRSLTDGLLFVSNASTQAGFVLSPAAFRCPLCARDSSFSHFRDLIFFDVHLYASGQKDALDNSLLSLLPSAMAELNILSSLKNKLSQPSSAGKDIIAASVTGMNGVSIIVNHVIDIPLKSSPLRDNTHTDWFVDAALRPGILHISVDPESDTNDHPLSFCLISIGVVAQPQGLPWNSGDVNAKGLAAVAHVRVKSSWLLSIFNSALVKRDSRHICMSNAAVCAIVNSRGYIVVSTAATGSTFKHLQTMYPPLAQALLDRKVFIQASSRRFEFSVHDERGARANGESLNLWALNSTFSSEFRVFLAESLYSVSIAQLPGVAGVLLIAVPRLSSNANVHNLEVLPSMPSQPTDLLVFPAALPPRAAPHIAGIDHSSTVVVRAGQESYCNYAEPSWLLGVSVGVGMAVLFFVSLAALIRFRVFQRVVAYFFKHKDPHAPVSKSSKDDELNRYEFKLCSPNDFPVQKSILRCVSVFQKAFAVLETQIVHFNTFSLSKRIIGDDIDGQRIKIQNYLEVLKKQRTLLHERIVYRMCTPLFLLANVIVATMLKSIHPQAAVRIVALTCVCIC